MRTRNALRGLDAGFFGENPTLAQNSDCFVAVVAVVGPPLLHEVRGWSEWQRYWSSWRLLERNAICGKYLGLALLVAVQALRVSDEVPEATDCVAR